jgi:hypothetical protein
MPRNDRGLDLAPQTHFRQILAPRYARWPRVNDSQMAICSAANPNPVLVIAALTRQITGVVVGLPVVDGLCPYDGPMGCVEGISGCWRASILVLIWTGFANIDKRENNNGRQQSHQYYLTAWGGTMTRAAHYPNLMRRPQKKPY